MPRSWTAGAPGSSKAKSAVASAREGFPAPSMSRSDASSIPNGKRGRTLRRSGRCSRPQESRPTGASSRTATPACPPRWGSLPSSSWIIPRSRTLPARGTSGKPIRRIPRRQVPRGDRRVANPLTIHDPPGDLRRPILIMAFAGWNDAAEAATTAARFLAQAWSAERFATIDPEEFYHFGLSRPHVRFKAGSETEREIIWPATEFSIAQSPELSRDVIVGVAAEPHLRWRTYCETVLELARRCEVALVLTLGAL